MVALTSRPALATTLLSDSVQIGDTVNGIIWPTIADGQGVTALSGIAVGYFNIVGQLDLPIESAAAGVEASIDNMDALEDLKVGVTALGAGTHIAALSMLKAHRRTLHAQSCGPTGRLGNVSPGSTVGVDPGILTRKALTVSAINRYDPPYLDKALAFLSRTRGKLPFEALIADPYVSGLGEASSS